MVGADKKDFGFTATQGRRVGFGGCDVGRNRWRAVQTGEMQQMAAAIDDGDTDSPVVFQGFSFGRSGDGFHIGQFQSGLYFHGVQKARG
jgi:hypothetical protein